MALSVPSRGQARAQRRLHAASGSGIAAAQAFFRKALASHPDRAPRKATLDGHAPSHRALRLLRREHPAWRRVRVRSSKYLNNIIEQDHRAIKVPELVPELLANQDDRCRIRMVRCADVLLHLVELARGDHRQRISCPSIARLSSAV